MGEEAVPRHEGSRRVIRQRAAVKPRRRPPARRRSEVGTFRAHQRAWGRREVPSLIVSPSHGEVVHGTPEGADPISAHTPPSRDRDAHVRPKNE